MDEQTNQQAQKLLGDLAERHGFETRVLRATFTGGGEGFSVKLVNQNGRYHGAEQVISFHNDDKFGPRWTGLAGRTVPAHKVIPYVNTYAENPARHPQDLNGAVLGH
jgi:hypothetical protein